MSATEPRCLPLLKDLIAFDTTSRNSNLDLIEFVRSYLRDLGVEAELVFDDSGKKANIYATLGPQEKPGIVLSGHTDVVPVDGQDWQSEPFELTRKATRVYARGTSDMKGFIAVCLLYAPKMLERNLHTTIHFAFSYDEEVGCLGVRSLLAELEQRPLKPVGCIIGEPTSMRIVRAHKGKLSLRCHVRGLEVHSGLAHLGVNAVEAASEAVAFLKGMARRFRDNGPFDSELEPPYTTVHTGLVHGGTALNIVPKACYFDFEFRHLPQNDPDELAGQLRQFVEAKLLPEMHKVSPETGFEWEVLSSMPGLDTGEDTEIVQLAKALTGANSSGKVSFGTEGGLFEQIGIPAVVCGPGSIEQAHKPNEFIELGQLVQCEAFVEALIEKLAAPAH